jgi:hypothetical protein
VWGTAGDRGIKVTGLRSVRGDKVGPVEVTKALAPILA